MRITNSMMIMRTMRDQNTNLSKMSKWNHDLSSLTNLHRPSDDPIRVARTLRLESDINMSLEYKENIQAAKSWLEKTETAMNEITSVYQRIRELGVQGANGILKEEDTQKVAQEIKELKNHLIQVGNDTYMGRQIFTGFKTDIKLLDSSGNYNTADGLVLATLPSELIEYKVGDSQQISVNITGDRIYGPLVGGKPKLFDDIDKLLTALGTANHEDASASLADMDNQLKTLLQVRGEVGAKVNMIDIMSERMTDVSINLKELLSKTKDTDVAETQIQLITAEAVYKASLSVTARIIQPTLVDFLR
ncbi:Flagellin and related hook-associated proteins [Acetoanaerobium sticklandii]|uniref:Flagellin and related hook-associated proteins n=1 Tax=Acetoanaerobium sticklandii (strain ATCC 12662 / DSM 519 / JCM 1433 / CCUG 9281 / NCIMB 10654 / HF) TaxID=499177 RepID=E3PUM7_ACESD|nr:flagellar hook-associated protein FlgL [Acetoanaerobium sticklandii]CBH22465.1 Flagellin and related hook-associated proteins [Acetoanaerobium sticklandii]